MLQYQGGCSIRCSSHVDAHLSPRQRRIEAQQRRWREEQVKRQKQLQPQEAEREANERLSIHGPATHDSRERPRPTSVNSLQSVNDNHQEIGLTAALPVAHIPGLLSDLKIEDLVEDLGSRLRYDMIVLEGREIQESRKTAWLSDNGSTFQYSGKEMVGGPLTPIIAKVRDRLALHPRLSIHHDSCLVNYYYNGKSGMRFHSDPLYDTWIEPTAVVSVGQTRRLIFRRTEDFTERHEFNVSNGDVVFMGESCQALYQHSIGVEKGEDAEDLPPRISLVFKKRSGS